MSYLFLNSYIHYIIADITIDFETMKLQTINILFGTGTYDEIVKDDRVTTEAALGIIGGTMGLFTGFSILSGVEIIYHIALFFFNTLFKKQK